MITIKITLFEIEYSFPDVLINQEDKKMKGASNMTSQRFPVVVEHVDCSELNKLDTNRILSRRDLGGNSIEIRVLNPSGGIIVKRISGVSMEEKKLWLNL